MYLTVKFSAFGPVCCGGFAIVGKVPQVLPRAARRLTRVGKRGGQSSLSRVRATTQANTAPPRRAPPRLHHRELLPGEQK